MIHNKYSIVYFMTNIQLIKNINSKYFEKKKYHYNDVNIYYYVNDLKMKKSILKNSLFIHIDKSVWIILYSVHINQVT